MKKDDTTLAALGAACAQTFLSRAIAPGAADELSRFVSPAVFASWSRGRYASQDEVGKLAWMLLVIGNPRITQSDIECLRVLRDLYLALEGPSYDTRLFKDQWRQSSQTRLCKGTYRLFYRRLRIKLALYEAGDDMDGFPRCALLVRTHIECLIKSMAQ